MNLYVNTCGRSQRAGSAAVDAQLDHRGHVPFEGAHHRTTGTVDIDLAQMLQGLADADFEDAGDLRRGDDRRDDGAGVVHIVAA